MTHTNTKTFAEHLHELKRRGLLVLVNFSVGLVAGFVFHKHIEAVLQEPLGQTLYFSNPAGGLGFVMQIAIGVGFVSCLPLLLFQATQFARPAFKPVKTRYTILMIICSLTLAIAAVLYVYFVSMPAALQFLVGFNSSSVQALINVNDYIRFVVAYCGGAIVAFHLPLIMLFANKVRKFPPGGLMKLQRPMILGTVIASAVITPTIDPVNQLLLAAPILLLFEISVVMVRIINRKTPQKAQVQKLQPQPVAQPKPVLQPRLAVAAAPAPVRPAPRVSSPVVTVSQPRPAQQVARSSRPEPTPTDADLRSRYAVRQPERRIRRGIMDIMPKPMHTIS